MLQKDKLNLEIDKINYQIGVYAKTKNMKLDEFLNSLENIDSNTVEHIIPLLKKQINLLEQLWKIQAIEENSLNLLLFKRNNV